jgi:hypothetical protein
VEDHRLVAGVGRRLAHAHHAGVVWPQHRDADALLARASRTGGPRRRCAIPPRAAALSKIGREIR